MVYVLCFYILPKKSLPNARTQPFYPMVSSRIFVILAVIFITIIHFKLIFIYTVKKGLRFICLHMDIQWLQHHSLSFFNISMNYLSIFVKNHWPFMFCLFLNSILFHWPICLPYVIPHCLICYRFIISFEIS